MLQTIEYYLRDCPDLNVFSDSEIAEIAAISKLVHFDRGHDVFSIEHQDKYIFVVADGLLSLRLLFERRSKKFKERDLFGEITLFSNGDRLGAIHCLEDVSLVAIDTTYILESNAQVSDTTRFRFLHAMGKKMATYFRNETEKTTHELIQELESEYLEFKSSIDFNNWNAMVRTVAGFMNLNGGTILCGVKDGGGAHTTFKTNRNDVDEFERKFRDLLIKHLGEAIPAVRVDYIENQNQHIVRIDVEPSTQPIFYTDTNKESQKREYFYIRTGNQNHPILFPSDIINYIQKRFKFNTQP